MKICCKFQSFSCSFCWKFHWKLILLGFYSLFGNKNLKHLEKKVWLLCFLMKKIVFWYASGQAYWIQEPACLKMHRYLQFLLQWALQELCKPRDRSDIFITMSESHSIRMNPKEKLLLLIWLPFLVCWKKENSKSQLVNWQEFSIYSLKHLQ